MLQTIKNTRWEGCAPLILLKEFTKNNYRQHRFGTIIFHHITYSTYPIIAS